MRTYTPSTSGMVADGGLASNAASYARHLRAANLSPKTQRPYLDALPRLNSFLAEHGMPNDVRVIRREHVEAFIEDQLARLRPASAGNRSLIWCTSRDS